MLEDILTKLPSTYETLKFITIAATLLVIIYEYAPSYLKVTEFHYSSVNKVKVAVKPGFQTLSRAIMYLAIGWIISISFVLLNLFNLIQNQWVQGVYTILVLLFWIYLVIPTIMASLSLFELVKAKNINGQKTE